MAGLTETEAMQRALALASAGWGRVHPNPLVGAVILSQGRIVGEGFHAEFGGLHAERVALHAAGAGAHGATMLVTLEPCSHHGKQPPCADALIEAGITRVVAAVADPTSLAGGGLERLRQAGIDTSLGLLEPEARSLNVIWLGKHRVSERPFVALKLATSLDHRIADASGSSKWISGPAAREYVHTLRAGFAAIAVGGHTALRDDPRLTVRGPIVPRVPPRRVVFQGREPLPETLHLVRTAREWPTLVVTAPEAEASTRARLAPHGADVVAAPGLTQALRELRRLEIDSLLVEGGGRLAGALLREGLVDRFYWIQSPLWLGDSGVPGMAGWNPAGLAQAERWRVAERRGLGEDTLLVLDRREDPCSPGS